MLQFAEQLQKSCVKTFKKKSTLFHQTNSKLFILNAGFSRHSRTSVFRNPLLTRLPHFAALILARSGSKGIPLKNLQQVGDKSLLEIAVRAAQKSILFDSVWVSTDHELIARETEKCKYIIECIVCRK